MNPGGDAGRYRADHLMVPGGWHSPGYIEIDDKGVITTTAAIQPPEWTSAEIHTLRGYVLPGMPNLHSHAHQRGLAGRAEGLQGRSGRNLRAATFWDWRERMYRFANALTPDDLQAVAAQAFLELLRGGFTTVGEFHYLHHDRDGTPYADPAELSLRVIAAAEQTGIALTLLPALYTQGGIGAPPLPEQRRFIHANLDAYLRLIESLCGIEASVVGLRIGAAAHSLRAVPPEELADLVANLDSVAPNAPIHIHAAEQTAEVDACLARLRSRPVRWLLDHLPIDERWTLIHATHINANERRDLAHSGATVGLCPTTEANLGDGLFPLRAYDRDGGGWGIGTDANLEASVAAELRLLEYGQRLRHRRRDIALVPGDPTTAQPGRRLIERALRGGARALSQPIGAITPGHRADLIVLDPAHPSMLAQAPETALDGWIFAGEARTVRDVMVAGTWTIHDGHHRDEERITRRYREVMHRHR